RQRDSGEAWPAHPLDGLWWGLAGGDHEGPGYLDAAVDRPRLVEPAAPWPAGRRVRRARHGGLRELALRAVPRRAASFLGRSGDGIRLWHAVAFRYRAARGIQRARRLWHRAGAMGAVRTEPSMAFWAGFRLGFRRFCAAFLVEYQLAGAGGTVRDGDRMGRRGSRASHVLLPGGEGIAAGRGRFQRALPGASPRLAVPLRRAKT